MVIHFFVPPPRIFVDNPFIMIGELAGKSTAVESQLTKILWDNIN